jgi:hypothetical protein
MLLELEPPEPIIIIMGNILLEPPPCDASIRGSKLLEVLLVPEAPLSNIKGRRGELPLLVSS